jgi:serine/threonine protein kinase
VRPFLLSAEHDPDAAAPGAEPGGAARAERNAAPPTPVVRENRCGERLGDRYLLEALVGRGLVGSVYRAQRLADGQLVAVKILHEELRDDPNVLRRFQREAAAAEQLTHPNIARVLEHGSEANLPYVCSEWIEGLPLNLAVERAPLTLRRALAPICDMLSALSAAQRVGVLHGCLKPSNVLVQEGQEGALVPKLLDFGMGRLLKPVPGRARTKQGAVCAVAEYLAPEQIACTETDGRTDVYAVGLLLYELLTGNPPFQGDSFESVLRRQCEEVLGEVASREYRGRKIPREVESLCLHALAKQPADRYHSPLEMARAARNALDLFGTRADLPLQPEPTLAEMHRISRDRLTMPGEQLRSRQKIGLGAGLLLLVCGVVWISAPHTASESPRAAAELATGQRLLERGRERLAADDVPEALVALRAAEAQLGESPAVQRWLGEALLRAGEREQGEALLRRYLASSAQPADRTRVEELLAEPQDARR